MNGRTPGCEALEETVAFLSFFKESEEAVPAG
jgi:hypothetical protein